MKKTITLFTFIVCLSFGNIMSENNYKAYLVSNAHFDSQWNWDVQTSINEFIPKTLNQNLFLLAKYPNYIFNFEGGIKYSWMKEYYPNEYELIKKYIKEDRWHVTGSTWDATDTNIPSTESFTRNILYGQEFYQDEFGVQGTDIFLPDCFGFGWTLPTIAAHSGLIGFSTQKLKWRNLPFYGDSKIPYEMGLWQGVDGSKIMLIADGHNYSNKWKDEDLSESKYLMNIAKSSPTNAVYHYYGTGDTGGSPDIQSVRTVEQSLIGKGPLQIISATSDQIYKDYLPYDNHKELPVFDGELLMDVHGTGCYTSQAAMKLFNRRNESLANAAERSAIIAEWLGGIKYPKQQITEAWKRFIWHQFHDDLTGTSIPKAYEFSWNDELLSLKDFENVLTNSVNSVAARLNTKVKGTPVVIFNPVANEVTNTVQIEANVPKSTKNLSVINENGETVPVQLLENNNGKVKLLITASVPPCGFVVYDLRTSASKKTSTLKTTENSIENRFYKIQLNFNGDIQSIFDKQNNRELVKKDHPVRLALFTENESFKWPAWEILKKTIDKKPISITDSVKISVVENGPNRSALCVERKFDKSTFKQYIRLSDGGQDDRIDIYNEIDWQTTNALLKAEFPLNLDVEAATYDLGIGTIKRGNNTKTAYEVYAQNWADMFDEKENYGVSILNDCKYGWDKPDNNTIRLTLLHTPKTKGNYPYQNAQDFGHHTFTYSICGHANNLNKAKIVQKAEILNQPLLAFVANKHTGNLGKSFSFVKLDNDNVQVKAIKQAEKSDDIIVRFYETEGNKTQSVSALFADNILSAEEVNGVESTIGNSEFSGSKLNFDIKPFGIKTFKIKLKPATNSVQNIKSTKLPLPYNIRTASFNAFRREVNFDGRGNSMAAELLPEKIEYNGLTFNLGNPETNNGMKCKGDSIILPQGKFNRIYLLAASLKDDVNTRFIIDGKSQEAIIPYYSGFIGQWGHIGHTEGLLKSGTIVYAGTHKHNATQNKDIPMEYTYMFLVELKIPENAKMLVLPKQSNIVLFSGILATNQSEILPASNLLNITLPVNTITNNSIDNVNLLSGKSVVEKTGEVNQFEKAEFAFDDDTFTKWCDTSESKNKFITIDLGKSEVFKSWNVIHAGIESLDYITKEFCLQVKQNIEDKWETVDSVYDNLQTETERKLKNPVKARYVRLYITKPDQSEGNVVRIYEFGINH